MTASQNKVLVLDFGSQYTQLITRRVRELGVRADIHSYDLSLTEVKKYAPSAIILSGGPSSVHQKDAPLREDIRQLHEIAPLLGICYGMQLMAHFLGGRVRPSSQGEYGRQKILWKPFDLCEKELSLLSMSSYFSQESHVWMSHSDDVMKLPDNFTNLAESQQGVMAVISDGRSLGLQFHPEVVHTENGQKYLEYFLFQMVKLARKWKTEDFGEISIEYIKNHVKPKEKVLCALSGGVDSTVLATLLTRALDSQSVRCVFVNNGLLRKNEYKEVLAVYKNLGLNVEGINAR